jgi:hypothetical protein
MKFNSINNSNFSFGQFNREFEYDTDSLLTNSNWGNDTSYPDLSAILNGKDLKGNILLHIATNFILNF